MLWLGLYFPRLYIDRLRLQSSDQAVVLVSTHGNSRQIIQCNDFAETQGIHSGIDLNTAYALSPGLRTITFEPDLQYSLMTSLAHQGLAYTSRVSTENDNTLLLEIAGSLKLFNGLENLLARIQRELRQQNLLYQFAVAPNPTAASLLAHSLSGSLILDSRTLQHKLAGISIQHLPVSASARKGLWQSGLRQCQDLLKLPFADLNRRFGQETGNYLNKLLGYLPDPRPDIQAPARFRQTQQLPQESLDLGVLQFTLNRLLLEFCDFLKRRDLGVRSLELILHQHHSRQEMRINFADSVNRSQHLMQVCHSHCEKLKLDEPVTAITLSSKAMNAINAETGSLFAERSAEAMDLATLIDIMRIRLGNQAVLQLHLQQSHQPEDAVCKRFYQTRYPGRRHKHTDPAWPLRPLWMLETPVTGTHTLRKLGSKERLNNAWTTQQPQQRDFHIARDSRKGGYYWVYETQEDHANTLYIKGIFS